MQAKFEIIASGSYEDAMKEGKKWADRFASEASDVSIKATRIKNTDHWKVVLKYTREEKDDV